ncbi:MAG: hypothetical protein LBG59_09845 [Candidatus Peribacteria bacterium]|jgi:hypothetical protein|nr:hypothetical protein [Candidatus Peribacteria bacterium]
MVIRTNDPHPFATLTVNGNVRIQKDSIKDTQCNTATMGTVKTIAQSNTNQVCSCLCNGKEWQPMLDVAECKNQCCGPHHTRNINTCEANCPASTINGYNVPTTN